MRFLNVRVGAELAEFVADPLFSDPSHVQCRTAVVHADGFQADHIGMTMETPSDQVLIMAAIILLLAVLHLS